MESALPGLAGLLPTLEASLDADGSARNVVRVAEAFRMAGQSRRAVELLQPVVEREPARISPRVLMAWCLEDLGRIEDAQGMLESVRAMDPGNPFAREPEPSRPVAPPPRPELVLDLAAVVPPPAPEPYEATPVAVVRDPEREAEPEAALTEEELRDIPPSPLYSATLAEIFEKQGFEGKAIEIYEEVVRRDPARQDLQDRITDLRARLAESAP